MKCKIFKRKILETMSILPRNIYFQEPKEPVEFQKKLLSFCLIVQGEESYITNDGFYSKRVLEVASRKYKKEKNLKVAL